jgi:hypothetical protein
MNTKHIKAISTFLNKDLYWSDLNSLCDEPSVKTTTDEYG